MNAKKLKNVTPHILILLIIMSIVGSRIDNFIYRIKNKVNSYNIYEVTEAEENIDNNYEYNSNIDYGYNYEIKSVGPITLEKATYTEYIYFKENSDYILIETYPENIEYIIEENTQPQAEETTTAETVLESEVAATEEEIDNSGLNIKILDENKEFVKEFRGIKNQAIHKVELEGDVKGKTYEVVTSGPGFYGYYNIVWGNSYQED